MQLPAIDQNICGSWTQQNVDFYNRLPYYFQKGQAECRKQWATFSKLVNKVPWEPNMGDTMKRVMIEPSPVLRQDAFPNLLSQTPKTDIINVRERVATGKPRWQDFQSPSFNWVPSFQDFMKGNIQPTMENITRQMSLFEESFLRTYIWSWSPYVYIAGYGLVAAPQADPDSTYTTGKSTNWMQAQCALLAGVPDGTLTFQEVFKALNVFEQEVGATPFSGSGLPSGDSQALNEKFALVTSTEVWNNFTNDPWLKENRPINMNIVSDAFKGDLFGRITTKMEYLPRRLKLDNDFVPSIVAPQTVQLDPDRDDYGRTYPNPNYSKISNIDGIGSQIEIGYLVGGNAYSSIEVGPPPGDFTKNDPKMNWNGKPYLTKDFLVPCADSAGTISRDANSFGRYLRLQGTVNVGCVGDNKFNIMPIIYKRRVGITTVTA